MTPGHAMRAKRRTETREERDERRTREAHMKADQAEAEDAAVDERVRQNLKLYGP